MTMNKIKFILYDKTEFEDFLNALPAKDAGKLLYTIENVEKYGWEISKRKKWIRKLDKNLYEIRARQASDYQRAVYFRYIDGQYVLTHGFSKKTNKTPEVEIEKAKYRRKNYLERRSTHHDRN